MPMTRKRARQDPVNQLVHWPRDVARLIIEYITRTEEEKMISLLMDSPGQLTLWLSPRCKMTIRWWSLSGLPNIDYVNRIYYTVISRNPKYPRLAMNGFEGLLPSRVNDSMPLKDKYVREMNRLLARY